VTEHGSPAEILDLAFRLYDVDGNGTIEMRELSEILRVRSGLIEIDLSDPQRLKDLRILKVIQPVT